MGEEEIDAFTKVVNDYIMYIDGGGGNEN